MTKTISKIFGKIASHSFPTFIQKRINSLYVKYFGIDLSEFDHLETYPTLNALFTRKLRAKREFDPHPFRLIAPCDSVLMEQGRVEHNMALQIKNMAYCVSEFVGEVLDQDYQYLNFYLSPKDYHRFHTPCDLEVLEVRYFGGQLLPVNQPSLLKNHNLFIRNERVVVVAKDCRGNKLYYVAVGALNVGQIILHFEERLQTNFGNAQTMQFLYPTPIRIAKGEEMGMFKMGSTIVLFASGFQSHLKTGEKIRFGQSIGDLIL